MRETDGVIVLTSPSCRLFPDNKGKDDAFEFDSVDCGEFGHSFICETSSLIIF